MRSSFDRQSKTTSLHLLSIPSVFVEAFEEMESSCYLACECKYLGTCANLGMLIRQSCFKKNVSDCMKVTVSSSRLDCDILAHFAGWIISSVSHSHSNASMTIEWQLNEFNIQWFV